jgi:hypothetical protein
MGGAGHHHKEQQQAVVEGNPVDEVEGRSCEHRRLQGQNQGSSGFGGDDLSHTHRQDEHGADGAILLFQMVGGSQKQDGHGRHIHKDEKGSCSPGFLGRKEEKEGDPHRRRYQADREDLVPDQPLHFTLNQPGQRVHPAPPP